MDTVLIKCPKCGEQMQAPQDREQIICMFCGEQIIISDDIKVNDSQTKNTVVDSDKCYDNLNFVLNHTTEIFSDFRMKIKSFGRNSYTQMFEAHKDEFYSYYTAIMNCLSAMDDKDAEAIYTQIASTMISVQQKELDAVKKSEKFSVQMDKNMYMAVFVLPSIKEIGSKKADTLAEFICDAWSKAFKDSNIKASDYDTIESGFHRKLCYITTAVCQNLNFAERDYALYTIKNFRDTYMNQTEDGRKLVEEYYNVAPTIVKRLERDADAQAKYAYIWNMFLAPCVSQIEAGKLEECKNTYCSMVRELQKTYMENWDE